MPVKKWGSMISAVVINVTLKDAKMGLKLRSSELQTAALSIESSGSFYRIPLKSVLSFEKMFLLLAFLFLHEDQFKVVEEQIFENINSKVS